MALTNLASGRTLYNRLAAVPAELRMTVLQAVNAPMAAEVEHLDSNAAEALTRVRKLDADTATEAVSYVTNPATLQALQGDSRLVVSDAVRRRASLLSLNLAALILTETKDSTPTTPSRTAKALAKPVDEVVSTLAKMATIDTQAVFEWATQQGADTPWHDLLTATNRHYRLSEQIIADALAREVVDPAALWDGWSRALIESATAHQGPLNATMVNLYSVAYSNDASPSPQQFVGITDEAMQALSSASLLVRQLCHVATNDEVVAGVRGMIAAYAPSITRYDQALSRLEAMFENVVTADMADQVAPLIDDVINVVGDSAWRFGNEISMHLIRIDGISNATARTLWKHMVASTMTYIIAGDLGPTPTHDDITWLLERFADEADEGFEVTDVLQRVGWNDKSEASENFVQRVLHELPGGAGSLLGVTRSWGTSWLVEVVMAEAGDQLGGNVAAWNVFMQQVDSHTGMFSDLVQAAIIATASN